MTKRDIIPEDSRAKLYVYYDEKDNVSPVFLYDADFIDSVLREGYVKTLERLKHPMNLSDNKKTDMLLKDIICKRWREIGLWDEKSYMAETSRFVRADDRVNSDVRMLIEGKIPVSDEIWSKANSLSNALTASIFELSERIENESESGDRFRGDPKCYQCVRRVEVSGVSPHGINRNFRFTLPIINDGGTIIRDLYMLPHHEDMPFRFHFRFDPAADKIADAWKMQSLLNDQSFSIDERYLLCKEVGVQFAEAIDTSFSCEQSERLTRGLIRIHNHLNNLGMSDEEYLSLING